MHDLIGIIKSKISDKTFSLFTSASLEFETFSLYTLPHFNYNNSFVSLN